MSPFLASLKAAEALEARMKHLRIVPRPVEKPKRKNYGSMRPADLLRCGDCRVDLQDFSGWVIWRSGCAEPALHLLCVNCQLQHRGVYSAQMILLADPKCAVDNVARMSDDIESAIDLQHLANLAWAATRVATPAQRRESKRADRDLRRISNIYP